MATYISKSPDETFALGERWGREASAGWVIGLSGTLGAGKTRLVQGIARGLGITVRVQSPTFTLVHEYSQGRLPLHHLDLYRLETPAAIVAAGLEPYLEPVGLSVIEWIDHWWGAPFPPPAPNSSLPCRYRHVRIECRNEWERVIEYEDFGD